MGLQASLNLKEERKRERERERGGVKLDIYTFLCDRYRQCISDIRFK